MFAYCNNNAIAFVDSAGELPFANYLVSDGPGDLENAFVPIRSCKYGVSYDDSERLVVDVTVSVGSGKYGASLIMDPISGQDEFFFHAGASSGPSVSLLGLPVGISVGAGYVWDYDGYNSYHGCFFDFSGNVLFGAEFCHGIGKPLGENTKAALAMVSTSCSASLGIDYYFKPEDFLHISDGAFSDILDILPIIIPLFKSK